MFVALIVPASAAGNVHGNNAGSVIPDVDAVSNWVVSDWSVSE